MSPPRSLSGRDAGAAAPGPHGAAGGGSGADLVGDDLAAWAAGRARHGCGGPGVGWPWGDGAARRRASTASRGAPRRGAGRVRVGRVGGGVRGVRARAGRIWAVRAGAAAQLGRRRAPRCGGGVDGGEFGWRLRGGAPCCSGSKVREEQSRGGGPGFAAVGGPQSACRPPWNEVMRCLRRAKMVMKLKLCSKMLVSLRYWGLSTNTIFVKDAIVTRLVNSSPVAPGSSRKVEQKTTEASSGVFGASSEIGRASCRERVYVLV